MAPFELRQELQKFLRETRDEMLSLEYLLAVDQLPAETRRTSALMLSQIQVSYLKLRDAELSDIRDELVKNEDALADAMNKAEKQLGKFNKIKARLDDVAAVLKLVGRVIAIV